MADPWSVSIDSGNLIYIVAHIFRIVCHVVFTSPLGRNLAASKFVAYSMICSTLFCFWFPVSRYIMSILNCCLTRNFSLSRIRKVIYRGESIWHVSQASLTSGNRSIVSNDTCSGCDLHNRLQSLLVEWCIKFLWRRSRCELWTRKERFKKRFQS